MKQVKECDGLQSQKKNVTSIKTIDKLHICSLSLSLSLEET